MGHSIIGMAEALVKIPIKNLHCNHNINIHLSFWRYFGWVQSKTNDSKCWYLKIGKKQSSRENELLGQSSETTKSTRMHEGASRSRNRAFLQWSEQQKFARFFPRFHRRLPALISKDNRDLKVNLNPDLTQHTKWSSSHFVNHKSAVLGCQKADLFIPSCASCG